MARWGRRGGREPCQGSEGGSVVTIAKTIGKTGETIEMAHWVGWAIVGRIGKTSVRIGA
jgi:hypothetical protein